MLRGLSPGQKNNSVSIFEKRERFIVSIIFSHQGKSGFPWNVIISCAYTRMPIEINSYATNPKGTELAAKELAKKLASPPAPPSVSTVRRTLNVRQTAGTQTMAPSTDVQPDVSDFPNLCRSFHSNQAPKRLPRPLRANAYSQIGNAVDISPTERALQQQLKQAEGLVASLTKQNEDLSQALAQERSRTVDLSDHIRSEMTYSHQVSRLIRVFRELDVHLPSLDSDEWDSHRIADGVRETIGIKHAREADLNHGSDSAMRCLQLLFGAAEVSITDKPNAMKFLLRNEKLDREMAFWLTWNDNTITYTKIYMNIPEKDAPEFWSEHSIDFEVRQGPNFLLQVLGGVFHES